MKKQSLLFIAGGILALASCNTDTAGNAEDTQAKVDSMVNVRVEEIRMDLEAKNDSIINEMAIYRADSIIAAMSGKKTTTKKPGTKVAPTSEAPVDKPKEVNSKSKWDEGKDKGTTSESKWGDKEKEKEGTTSDSKWK